MTRKIRLAIADDHPMVIDGLLGYFSNHEEIDVVATVKRASEIPGMCTSFSPDVLLMDYHFTNEELTGLDLCQQIQRDFPLVKIIIISSFNEVSLIKKFIESGASGYLLKTATQQEYIDAVLNVFAGGQTFGKEVREMLIKDRIEQQNLPKIQFTKTEKEILKLIVEGCSTNDIAKKLFREKSTIDSHRKSILAKLQLMDTGNPNPSKNILHYVARFDLIKRIDEM